MTEHDAGRVNAVLASEVGRGVVAQLVRKSRIPPSPRLDCFTPGSATVPFERGATNALPVHTVSASGYCDVRRTKAIECESLQKPLILINYCHREVLGLIGEVFGSASGSGGSWFESRWASSRGVRHPSAYRPLTGLFSRSAALPRSPSLRVSQPRICPRRVILLHVDGWESVLMRDKSVSLFFVVRIRVTLIRVRRTSRLKR